MTKTVEFWFDYGSPTAYLAHRRLKDVARRVGAAMEDDCVMPGPFECRRPGSAEGAPGVASQPR